MKTERNYILRWKYLYLLFLINATVHVFAQVKPREAIFVCGGSIYVDTLYKSVGGEWLSTASLRIDGDMRVVRECSIHQEGLTVLSNDFINDAISGNVFNPNSTGQFEFRGEEPQLIDGTANRTLHYILFPNLIINNQTPIFDPLTEVSTVTLSPAMGITTKDLYLERGRFILDSDISDGKTRVGHLLVNGEVFVPTDNSNRIAYDKGLMQVNYKLGNDEIKEKVFGITPPFKKIYADYFIYNLVSRPTNKGLFGDHPRLFSKPTDYLLSGNGYLIGIGVVPLEVYQNNQNPIWQNVDPNERITNMISFVRDFAPYSLMQFVNYNASITDKYSLEVIQTEGVNVTVEKGWNYIGNPYTVPINMEEFLLQTGSAADWGISLSDNFEPSYHIFKDGTGTYEVLGDDIDAPVSYRFDLNFDEVNSIGGTGDQTTLVGPMQMIKIFKTSEGTATLTIPAKIRTHGDMVVTKSDKDFFVGKNELLIETKENITSENINIYYNQGEIIIKGLNYENMGDVFALYNINGKLLKTGRIENYPVQAFHSKAQKGMYIVKITGKKNVTQKLIVH